MNIELWSDETRDQVGVRGLIEALLHCCWPRGVVVREGVVRPVVPVPWRRVRHCQATRVAVPHLGGAQRDDVARGGL